MRSGRGVFVTGTDTGVGKTLVSSALVRRLVQTGRSVGVMKPVETGVDSWLRREYPMGSMRCLPTGSPRRSPPLPPHPRKEV